MTLSPLYIVLMFAGLVPFAVLAAWFWVDGSRESLQPLNLYSFGIVSFLVGTWWQPLAVGSRVFGALVGNALFLVAAGLLVWAPNSFPIAAALLLLLIFVLEQCMPWVGLQQRRYRRSRLMVTACASVCLIVVQLRV